MHTFSNRLAAFDTDHCQDRENIQLGRHPHFQNMSTHEESPRYEETPFFIYRPTRLISSYPLYSLLTCGGIGTETNPPYMYTSLNDGALIKEINFMTYAISS
jgi:hypothetical protein